MMEANKHVMTNIAQKIQLMVESIIVSPCDCNACDVAVEDPALI